MDLKTGKLSLKYAQAFVNLYGANLTQDDFWQIKQVISFLAKNSAVLSFFNTHRYAEQVQINRIFISYFKLPSNFEQLLLLLQKHKRIILLSQIMQLILEQYLLCNKQVYFDITSYPQLQPAQIKQVLGYLKKSTGCEILYQTFENKNLIAGLKMQGVQLLYDNTIQGRLQKIHRKLIRQN